MYWHIHISQRACPSWSTEKKGPLTMDVPNFYLYISIFKYILQGLAKLEYRSIFWHKEYLEPPGGFFQPAWVVNYPGGDVGGSQYKGYFLQLHSTGFKHSSNNFNNILMRMIFSLLSLLSMNLLNFHRDIMQLIIVFGQIY